MKTAEDILREAPISKLYQAKIAFVCQHCIWWSHDWNVPNKDHHGQLLCGKCGHFLKALPLEPLIATTREKNPEQFDAFIQANAANSGAPREDES